MFTNNLFCFLVSAIVINLTMAKNYYIQTSSKQNWFAAFEACEAQGLELATVNSASEENDLESAIKASSVPKEYIWISGTSLANPSPATFVWMSSGQTFAYTDWDVNQPDNSLGQEHCVHVWPVTNNGRTYAWNDNVCTVPMYYACQDKVCPGNNNGNNNGGDCNNNNKGNDCNNDCNEKKAGGLVTNLLGELL